MERVSQQPIGMQFHQPLALLYVTLPARYIFGVLCVHHHHSDPQLGENIVDCDPVHPGGLQRHCVNPALEQPLPHALQIVRPTAKFLHRMGVPISGHGHEVALIAYVDPPGIGVYYRQSRIVGNQLPPQLSPLFAVESTTVQPLENRLLLCHSNASLLETDPGSARLTETSHTLQRGRASLLQGRYATNQYIATAKVML